MLGSACRGRGQGDDEGGGRIEHDAKKKRALHSRFNRKTSFIRSFIIIKEPGKLPYSTLVAPRSENDDQRVKEGAIRYGKGKKKERKKERVGEREGERALRYYFGSLIIFSSPRVIRCTFWGRGAWKRDSLADVYPPAPPFLRPSHKKTPSWIKNVAHSVHIHCK